MRRVFLSLAIVALPVGSLELASCGGHVNPGSDATVTDSGIAQDRIDEPYFPEASCFVRIDSPPRLPGNHVPIGSDITTWNSNPPSSGDHYPIWAAYQEYDSAVPRGYYVHDLEHGAIDFLYDCDLLDGGMPPSDASSDASADADPDATVTSPCDAIVEGMRAAVASIPDDPLCDPSVRVRHVITPDPLLQYPVAAAAWGWTYNAACIDVPTLKAFANAHYGQGTEDFCTNGTTGF